METIEDLVSVIIPTYNRSGLIVRSAQSILNQTYKNLELIIVDDGSTDNTEDVVKKLNDSRVIYIKQTNQGACAARNNGIDHARGQFIAFQDSDDVWHEDKLERQIKTLKETGADVVICNIIYHYSKNMYMEVADRHFSKGFIKNTVVPLGICPQMLLCKSEIFKDNRFDIEMPRYQDFELLLRLQKKYTFYYDNVALVDYYIQQDSISKDGKKLLKAWDIILNKHTDFFECYKNNLDLLARITMGEAFLSKDTNTKKQLVRVAFRFKNNLRMKVYYIKLKLWFSLKNKVSDNNN